jgi:hypothetical protein
MYALVIAMLAVLSGASAAAQSQDPSPAQGPRASSRTESNAASAVKGGVFKSDLGFSYSYSSDWKDLTNTKLFDALDRMRELVPKNGKENSKRDLATLAAECRKTVLMLACPVRREGPSW